MIASSGSVLQLDDPLALRQARRRRRPRATASTRSSARTSSRSSQQCGWRINGKGNAAERLGIHPNTLRFRMKKLGLRRPSTVGPRI